MGVAEAGLASIPVHRRPRFARRIGFRLWWTGGRFFLIVAGLLLAAVASPILAAVLGAALFGAWCRRRYVRGRRYQKRMLKAAFVDLCKQDPGTPREDLLFFLIQTRHPRWDPEMIGQMVRDHPTVDGLLESLVRLERQVLE